MKRSAAILKHFYFHIHFLNTNSVFTILKSLFVFNVRQKTDARIAI